MMSLLGCSSSAQTPPDPTTTGSTTLTVTDSISPMASAATQPKVTASIGPTVTAEEIMKREAKSGVDELDRIIQIVLEGDGQAIRSLVRYTMVECTSADGLGGPPKCKDGEVEGETVEVLPFLGPEGHFIRKEEIDSWIGIDATDIYAVYSVSVTAYSDPIYPSGRYAIAFINEAGFLITTLQIGEGQIVRVDSNLGNPPTIRLEDVDTFLINPLVLDQ